MWCLVEIVNEFDVARIPWDSVELMMGDGGRWMVALRCVAAVASRCVFRGCLVPVLDAANARL